jgi:pumilio RNA-binding family
MCRIPSIQSIGGNQEPIAITSAPNNVHGNVWKLSQDPKGSRAIQQAIETAESKEQRESLAHELSGHIFVAIQCPHANHVLQKCVSILEPASLQFIIDEIATEGPQAICKLAQHRYACRVLEGLLAHCSAEQLFKIVGSLLVDIVDMSMHRYANYVVQRLLEHKEWCPVVLRILEGKASELARSFFGSLVLTHALRKAPQENRAKLGSIIASDSDLISEMKRFRHGPALLELVMANA